MLVGVQEPACLPAGHVLGLGLRLRWAVLTATGARARARRLRECGGLEGVSRQGKAWLLDLYKAGNREAARALWEAEKAQHASGCLHCRGPHRQGPFLGSRTVTWTGRM